MANYEGVIFLGVIGFLAYSRFNRGRTIKRLREEYNEAIHSGDRHKALNLGRGYYAKTRSGFFGFGRGRLTIYDEQALTNDLSLIDKK
jgi:hypothetical protein